MSTLEDQFRMSCVVNFTFPPPEPRELRDALVEIRETPHMTETSNGTLAPQWEALVSALRADEGLQYIAHVDGALPERHARSLRVHGLILKAAELLGFGGDLVGYAKKTLASPAFHQDLLSLDLSANEKHRETALVKSKMMEVGEANKLSQLIDPRRTFAKPIPGRLALAYVMRSDSLVQSLQSKSRRVAVTLDAQEKANAVEVGARTVWVAPAKSKEALFEVTPEKPTVGALKDAIKKEKRPELDPIAADRLKIYVGTKGDGAVNREGDAVLPADAALAHVAYVYEVPK